MAYGVGAYSGFLLCISAHLEMYIRSRHSTYTKIKDCITTVRVQKVLNVCKYNRGASGAANGLSADDTVESRSFPGVSYASALSVESSKVSCESISTALILSITRLLAQKN